MAKYPPDHYPPSAIQHTLAVTALTTAQMCVELYAQGDGTGEDDKMMANIKRRISACSSLTKKKRLSAGAKRDMSNCAIIIADHIENMKGRRDEKLIRAWAELVWCALTFIEDVLATCPQYTDGPEKPKWQKLQYDMEELANGLREQFAGIDEAGTYLYERAAWALDGVNFKLPEAA